ncbi:MAG: NADH-quinone oxidoreductase subunit L, partial [Methylobacteriaceae bacterium]|nr:NADH-quinone oxidoreductase subunit L [Methylobacteriaceae bacterium]
MIVAIVFLPLLGFLIAGCFGRFIGARPSEVVTTSLLFVCLLFSWITFAQVGFGSAQTTVPVLGNWFTSGP